MGFEGVRKVVADPLRFKRSLAIGEDAYASLRLKKHLGDAWDSGGAALTGAAVAASPAVASTFFASTATGGVLGWLGLGTAAATPIGWVIAAAMLSGGAYYGVVRKLRGYAGSRVETIPKFINTPLDLLAASLFDLVGGLATKLALIDGRIDETEKRVIGGYFVSEWGLDPDYVEQALLILVEDRGEERIRGVAEAVARFVADNPDCNAEVMRAQIVTFLRDVAEADGAIDEREELAIEAIERMFAEEGALTFRKVREKIGIVLTSTAKAVGPKLKRT